MLKHEGSPWVDYLEIDEYTNERKLSVNAPDNVKKAYKEYKEEISKNNDNKTLIPK